MENLAEATFFTTSYNQDVIEEIKESLKKGFKNIIRDLYHENKYFGCDINLNINGQWSTIFLLNSKDGEYRVTVDPESARILDIIIKLYNN